MLLYYSMMFRYYRFAGVFVVVLVLALATFWLEYWAPPSIADGIFGWPRPRPNVQSQRFVANEQKVSEAIKPAFADLDTEAIGLTYYSSSQTSSCVSSDNGFGAFQNYANECYVATTRYYGANGNFRSLLLGLGNSLRAGGWRLDTHVGVPVRDVVGDYDSYHNNTDPDDNARTNGNFGGEYLVSDLQAIDGYFKGPFDLRAEYAERATLTDAHYVPTADNISLSAIRTITANNDYVVAISIQATDFRN
jgi:hypothetical protein